MKVTMVKVIRSVDNNNFTTELGRFARRAELLCPPTPGTKITLGVDNSFIVNTLDQNLMVGAVELYNYVDLHYRTSSEEFEVLKKKLQKNGWVTLPKQ